MRKNTGRFLSCALALLAALMMSSCNWFSKATEEDDWESKVTAIQLDKSKISIDGGSSEYIKLTITPPELVTRVIPRWTAAAGEDGEELFTVDGTSSGCVITGKREGKGYIKCELNNIVATCLVDVTSNDVEIVPVDYYIYSEKSTLELTPGMFSQVSVNLFNGPVEAYEDFTWEVMDSSVASISYARNNCNITANKIGSTQVIARHPMAEYPYTFIVFVYADLSQGVPYINTKTNVVTINTNVQATREIKFEVKNDSSNGMSATAWSYADTTKTGAGRVVSITNSNSDTLHITGLRTGQAEITVTNACCEHPLRIIVIVCTIVKNVYVTTSASSAVISGEGPYEIFAYLNENGMLYGQSYDNEDFTWTVEAMTSSIKNYSGSVSDYLDFRPNGNTAIIAGKKNGVFKVRVGHKFASGTRSVILMLTEQPGSAVDASMFISTSDNYVQTQVNGEEKRVTIILVGGQEGDEKDFVWTVSSDDGNPMDMLTYTCAGFGTVKSRSALTSGTDAVGTLYIEPNKTSAERPEGITGDVTITVSHPKCLYTAEILVRIYSQYALLKDPVKITIKDGEGTEKSMIDMLYGSQGMQLKAELSGSDDIGGITWTSSDTGKVTVNPASGDITVATPSQNTETPAGTSYVTAGHSEAQSPKRLLVRTAKTQEEINKLKGVYSENTYIRLSADPNENSHLGELKLITYGIKEDDSISAADLKSQIKYKVEKSGVCSAVLNDVTDKECVTLSVAGLSAGKTTVEAWWTDGTSECAHVVFDITVVPPGESTDVIKAAFLTTTQYTAVIENPGGAVELRVTGTGIDTEDMQNLTTWTVADAEGAEIIDINANGPVATIFAKKLGKTSVTVSNPKSVNKLTINIKVGAIYEYEEGFYAYITTEQDTYTMVKGDTLTIGAALVNANTTTQPWIWRQSQQSQSTAQVNIAPVSAPGITSSCHIEAIEAGMSYIEISNGDAIAPKEILLVVGNTAEELRGYMYMTTTQNVVTVGEQKNVSVMVSVENTTENIVSGYEWTSDNESAVSVVGSGNVAVFYGKKQGTAKITVTNGACAYPLEIIANCVDPVAAAENPYISCSSIVTLTEGDTKEITADIVGGTPADYIGFTWQSSESGKASTERVVDIDSSNETCRITAKKSGVAQITIKHPKANGISRPVLVVVNPAVTGEYAITSTDSLIQTLSPSDGAKTLTVTLEGGTAADQTKFNWTTDDTQQKVVALNATENYCVVEPKSPGTAKIFVTHHKIPGYQKIFTVTVTKYKDFMFNVQGGSLSMTAGETMSVKMNTPGTDMPDFKGTVSYVSSDTSVVSIDPLANAFVCPLTAKKTGSATITATYRNGSTVAGQDSIIVYVENAKARNSYIKLNSPSYMTAQYGDSSIAMSADVYVDDAKTNEQPTWNSKDGKLRMNITAGKGNKMVFSAAGTGLAEVTVTYGSLEPVSAYVLIAGQDEKTLSLNFGQVTLTEKGGQQKLTATIINGTDADYKSLNWEIISNAPESKDPNDVVARINGEGKVVNVVGEALGTAKVKVSIGNLQETCSVTVEPPPEITFEHEEYFIAPKSKKATDQYLKFKVNPPSQEIYEFTSSNGNAIKINKEQDYSTGKVLITPGEMEDKVTITGFTKSGVKGSCVINVSKNFYLNWNKTLSISTPDETSKSMNDPFTFKFEMRPDTSVLILAWDETKISLEAADNCDKEDISKNKAAFGVDGKNRTYKIKPRDFNEGSKIAKCALHFKASSEVKEQIYYSVWDWDSDEEKYVSTQFSGAAGILELKSCYPTKALEISDSGFTKGNSEAGYGGKYSRYDKNINAIILGDGEMLTFNITSDKGSELNVKKIAFDNQHTATLPPSVNPDTNGTDTGKAIEAKLDGNTCSIRHNIDYGWYGGDGVTSDVNKNTDSIAGLTWSDAQSKAMMDALCDNDTVVYMGFAGYLTVTYYNIALEDDTDYKFKVYVEVRNNRCMD